MVTFFGFFYVCFLISHIYLIREYTYGKFFVWLVFICAFGCDTGAYFSGMLFGKRKLIPELSPKKTVEGAVGGVITATVVAVVYGICIERYFKLENVNTTILCLITGIAGSVLSQIGDLAASSVKRFVNLKDYGNLIPGHGGILDRFDSVLLTAPVVYYIMLFLIEVL
ncbi:Phosphatidate cytidylyltransferase [bioreactor metagenome]|uniref:Phosphatidate cytidylyltransferase n=1 Tax=bioreactor metagenome TaxID=1076179 RepID=A0A645I675_9ZZZZ